MLRTVYFTSTRTESGRIPEIAGRIPRRSHRLRAAVRVGGARHDQIRLGLRRVERELEAPPRIPRVLTDQPRRLPASRHRRPTRRRARWRSRPPTRTRRRRSCPTAAVAPSSGRVISDFTTRPVSGAMSLGSTVAPGATRLVGIAITGGHPEAVELAIEDAQVVQPLDRVRAFPARDDRAQREPVHRRDRLPVHLVARSACRGASPCRSAPGGRSRAWCRARDRRRSSPRTCRCLRRRRASARPPCARRSSAPCRPRPSPTGCRRRADRRTRARCPRIRASPSGVADGMRRSSSIDSVTGVATSPSICSVQLAASSAAGPADASARRSAPPA